MKVLIVGSGGVGESTVFLQKEYGFPGGMLEMDSEYKRALDHAGFVAPVERTTS
jgi:hypothetical protein